MSEDEELDLGKVNQHFSSKIGYPLLRDFLAGGFDFQAQRLRYYVCFFSGDGHSPEEARFSVAVRGELDLDVAAFLKSE